MESPGPILLIDDDEALLNLLERILVAAGYPVCTAPNVDRALDLLNDQFFPVILMELRLPGIDGLEFLRNYSPPESRILFLTAHGSVETAVQAMKLGAWSVLEKPFRARELCAQVDEALYLPSPSRTRLNFAAPGERPGAGARPARTSARLALRRLLVASGDAVVRIGLHQLFHEALKKARIEAVATEADLLDRLRSPPWEAVVLDLSLFPCCPLERLQQLRNAHPPMPLLVRCVTPHPVKHLVDAGASACLNAQATDEQWLAALHSVQQGEPFLCPDLARRLVHETCATERPLHAALSRREYQVLCGLGAGKPVKEIARDLALSPKTVQATRRRLLEKMGLRTDLALARYAWEHGLSA